MRTARYRMAAVFALLVFFHFSPNESTAQEYKGVYTAVLVEDGKPQGVRFDINDMVVGGAGNSLRFNRPRNCGMQFEYGGYLEGYHYFYYVSSMYAPCKEHHKQSGMYVKVVFEDGGALVLDFFSDSGKLWSAKLEKN